MADEVQDELGRLGRVDLRLAPPLVCVRLATRLTNSVPLTDEPTRGFLKTSRSSDRSERSGEREQAERACRGELKQRPPSARPPSMPATRSPAETRVSSLTSRVRKEL